MKVKLSSILTTITMLSTVDLERLITVKRREIEKEKMLLGLSPKTVVAYSEECKPESKQDKVTAKVSNITEIVEDNEGIEGHNQNGHKSRKDLEDISPELDRYIRRYLGLPVMLKAGEYSPNNPLIRGERPSGDALLGLGEYERRRNTLRKLRQQQYREYLDQQAKKKQEAKEKADRERRQREEREREEEERERERLERERASPERRRTYNYENIVVGNAGHYVGKVDTGVQVESMTHPLSVAVQTDDTELYRFSRSDNKLTEAERELSPRTVLDRGDNYSPRDAKGSREKVTSELRHTYKPSIFDADAIHMRNLQVEKEAAEKRQFYQQELRNQIKEQQRIREERKAREKMLEIAEMRRLEEQLRMLRVAQETEIGRQVEIDSKMRENATDYEKKRSALQKEIDTEQRALYRKTLPTVDHRNAHTSRSDPLCHRADDEYTEAKSHTQPASRVNVNVNDNVKSHTVPERSVRKTNARRPFSMNIPETSIFSPNYDVDSYLRRNLNPSKHSLGYRLGDGIDKLHEQFNEYERDYNYERIDSEFSENNNKVNRITEKVLIHEQPKQRGSKDHSAVPVPRRSPKSVINEGDNDEMSDAMKIVDGKWQVPVVQKSVLKSQPSEEGKKVSILTQLGSIRRQLQMEQLRLDNISNGSV